LKYTIKEESPEASPEKAKEESKPEKAELKKAPHDMNKILNQMEQALVNAKENFINKTLMQGQQFRNFAHQMIHYLYLVKGKLEDISEKSS